MPGASGQIWQPIPLFYGALPAGATTQDLEPGFDYVISQVWLSCTGAAGEQSIALADESGVTFGEWFLDAAGAPYPQSMVLPGEMPIGPRTALTITASTATIWVAIGGYAVTPVSALHV